MAAVDRPGGAPELNAEILDTKRRDEIEATFNVEADADVVTELAEPPENKATDTVDSDDEGVVDDAETHDDPRQPNAIQRFATGYWRHKRWTVPLTILLLLGGLLAVPTTRYLTLGSFMQKDVSIQVIDKSTEKPVPLAKVALSGGTSAITNTEGRAVVKASVGMHDVSISKKYYASTDTSVTVEAWGDRPIVDVTIKATGRQVPLSVVNKLTGKPVKQATLKAAGTEIKTDDDGKAVLVLPADKPAQVVQITADKFNGLKAEIVVTEADDPKNTFTIVPSGKVYLLSKQSGKIDLVKTNLDGSERQVVVAGTGKEEDRNTILLANRDWKYLTLLSRRDSDKPKLYLISTADDKLTIIDEGDAGFTPIGWSDNTFVYGVTRNALKEWQPKRNALKSYNAASNKMSLLDENQAIGDQNGSAVQSLANYYLLGSKVIYTVGWGMYYGSFNPGVTLADKTNSIRIVSASGGDKKDLKTSPADKISFQQARLYAPDEVYFAAYSQEIGKSVFFEYEDGVVKPAIVDEEDFYSKYYPTYLASPSGTKSFWTDQRDGKDTFFTGDKQGKSPQLVAVLSEYQVYGWYTDDYLLASKKGSELFIMPADGSKLTKVTDYHRPNANFRGYGGGYGGLY